MMRYTMVFCAFLFFGAGALIIGGCSRTKEKPKPAEMTGHEGHDHSKADASSEEEATQESAPLRPQETCPVMGNKIDKSVYADYEGQRVYFCCPDCVEPFKKDPEKFLAKMKAKGEKPEQLP